MKRISVIFGLAVFAWVFRTLLNGIEVLSGLTDAGIAIIAAILIFMTPSASKIDLLHWEKSKIYHGAAHIIWWRTIFSGTN